MRAEAQQYIDRIDAALDLLRRFLDWDRALRRLDELNARVEDPTLWDNAKLAQEVMRERRRLVQLWDYQANPAAGGIQHTAGLYSRVAVDPETGRGLAIPDAQLILRRHPEWGESAYLVLEMSTLRCGPPCRLKIRFDDAPARDFAGEPADTGTGPALFIKDEPGFLKAMSEAKRVRIELPRNGVLVPTFEFEVGGYRPELYRGG